MNMKLELAVDEAGFDGVLSEMSDAEVLAEEKEELTGMDDETLTAHFHELFPPHAPVQETTRPLYYAVVGEMTERGLPIAA